MPMPDVPFQAVYKALMAVDAELSDCEVFKSVFRDAEVGEESEGCTLPL